MIGQFRFASEASEKDVVLDMAWADAFPCGRVVAPQWVRDILKDNEVRVRDEDEFIGLSAALSYGVLVATLSGAKLTLSGDRTVWPDKWGMLDDRSSSLVRSH